MSGQKKTQSHIAAFLAWWFDEIKDMLPASRSTVDKSGETYVRIYPTPDTFEISYVSQDANELLAECVLSPTALAQTLTDLRTARKDLASRPLRYEVSPPEYMMWLKTRPAQAVRRLKDLAKIDVKTSTPLGTDDVVIAVHISEKTKTQIKTQDYAIKRSTLDRIATFCETANVALDQLGPQNSSVDFLAELSVGKSRSIFEFQKWTAICCLSAALILGGLWVRQSKTLNQLNLRASSLQADALSARQTTGQLETRYTQLAWMIDRRKNYSSVVEAWEKLSLALPEQAWLSELQQTGNDLEVIGFAKQAAPLVNLLENDPAFEAVRLAAPISLDNRSGTERFSLALRVVPGAVSDSQELSE